jgi:hypothetical protein
MKIEKKVLLSVEASDLIDGVFYNKGIVEVADSCFCDMPELKKVVLPKVKKIGSYCFSYNEAMTEVSLPALTTCGSYCFSYNQAMTEVSLPALTTCGSDCFSYNQAMTEVSLPALTTCGSDCFRSNQAMTEVTIGKIKLAAKDVDGSCFIIEAKKTSKGIHIYTGYNFLAMDKKVIEKQPCYVAEKEKFTAHGDTVKKAKSDLEFKVVAEKLKKEPITKDTEFTVKYYRLLTGACSSGCRGWMERNNIPYTMQGDEVVETRPYKAAEIIPLLEKTNAYGFERVKLLLTF